jgi:hypothetical protein
MSTVGPYELVQRIDGSLWRVRGPDLVDYTLVQVAEHRGLATRVRHLRIPGMSALVDHGPGYLVYENLPGSDLATEVRLRGPLRGERLATLLKVTARVLADLHRAGTAHGGMSPERVFLDGDRVVVAGPVTGLVAAWADLAAWAELARFAATGDGAVPLSDRLADLLIDCRCRPVDRRPTASELCRRVELLTLAPHHSGDPWAELRRRMTAVTRGAWSPGRARRVPRALVRAYDQMLGTAPSLELLYQFAAHDEREGGPWASPRRGDKVAWTPPAEPHGPPGAELTVSVELRNRGRLDWHDRFLLRSGPAYGPHILDVPELTAVPDTPPRGVATVPVRVVLPGGPGVYGQRLTLVDEEGRCRLSRAEAGVIVRAHAVG